jgi:hypothetical protein
MSEQLGERHEQRSLYGEQALSHNYEDLTMPQLQEKLQQFIDFTLDPTTLPAHKKIVRDMMDTLIFEIDWRVSRGVE